MRIACLHVPQFALQCATRLDPSLRGAPIAVVAGAVGGQPRTGPLHAPIVVACSRAAWALGVRLGMTATAARALSPELHVVTAEASIERETTRAIAEVLLGLTPVVDLGGRVGAGGAHLALYAEVPSRTRGASFGERLLDRLDAIGLTGRVGIADDRFTAWVAAAHGAPEAARPSAGPAAGPDRRLDVARAQVTLPGAAVASGGDERAVVVVPRGGSAAFLAPRSLGLLSISPEVQHMLEALGVRTLGEFAALPAPSIARPLEADYQGLARGESGATLRPYVPESPAREEIVVSAGHVLEQAGALSTPAAIALVSRHLALRLEGRGRGAARLEVTALVDGEAHVVPVTLAEVPAGPEELARVLAPTVEALAGDTVGQPWRLRVVITGEVVEGASATEVATDAALSPLAVAARGADEARGADTAAMADAGTMIVRPGETIDPLAVVLSTPGSLFTLSPPDLRAERRDAHRRTRRGKQRRSRPTPGAQPRLPRLFDRSSS